MPLTGQTVHLRHPQRSLGDAYSQCSNSVFFFILTYLSTIHLKIETLCFRFLKSSEKENILVVEKRSRDPSDSKSAKISGHSQLSLLPMFPLDVSNPNHFKIFLNDPSDRCEQCSLYYFLVVFINILNEC